jgi:DNA-binding MarR family transcriptional regulator
MAIHPLLHKTLLRTVRVNCMHSPGAFYMLGVLKHNGIQSMSEIGKKLAMSKPNVTSLVDKIVAEEWAERLPDENDRRIINIRITEKGIQAFDSFKRDMSDEMYRKLEVFQEDELEVLRDSSEKIKDMLRSILNAE